MQPFRAFGRGKATSPWVAALVILALVACSPSQSQDEPAAAVAPAATASVPSPAASTSVATPAADSDDAVIRQVSETIRKHRLTSLADACLDYVVDDSDGATVDVDVHEKHDAACGGDPDTSPRLFSFKLDRASGQLSTDALDLADGDFQPIE
ncbi:hypothetical protein [Dyella telluris]|uniref:hypothetical protein n=1 Tax=Dyella telluris TaxID=2763498 RepID=UPI001C9B5495|nr:hypothetical protein [Dyella telluris]